MEPGEQEPRQSATVYVGSLISRSWRMTWENKRVFMSLAVVAGCLSIPQALLGFFAWRPGLKAESYHMFLGLLLLAIIIADIVLAVYFTGAVPIAVTRLSRGRGTTWFDAMKAVSEKELFLRILWVLILIYLFIFAGLILFIVPGIIFAVWCLLAIPLVVLEDKSGTRAIRRSKELVSPKFKEGLLLFVVLVLLFITVTAAVYVPAWLFLGEGFVDATRNLVLSAWGYIVGIFLWPFTLVSLTLFHFDRIGGIDALPRADRI